jgi:hypothetical protein
MNNRRHIPERGITRREVSPPGLPRPEVKADEEIHSRWYEVVEIKHDFSYTGIMSPGFSKTCAWGYPWQVDPARSDQGTSLHPGMRDPYGKPPLFFTPAARSLKNEILGPATPRQTHDRRPAPMMNRFARFRRLQRADDAGGSGVEPVTGPSPGTAAYPGGSKARPGDDD